VNHIDEQHGQNGGLQDIFGAIRMLESSLVDNGDGEEDETSHVDQTDHRDVSHYIAIAV